MLTSCFFVGVVVLDFAGCRRLQREAGCSESPAAESAPVRMKGPACATENASEIRVSQPYYYKSSNSWGLKIGKKQVIGVLCHH